MPKLDRQTLLFSLNSYAASMLALYVALAAGLERPYWAMATAYIVSQPLSGAVRSKAVYRLVGTVLGGIITVALVPTLVNTRLLLCLALALWVGLCLALSLLDRTPRSYMMMLSGYTAALIGFPSVNHPEAVFDVAVARVIEIGLGIIAATVVHSIFFPQAVGPVLRRRIGDWIAEADGWALAVLDQSGEATVSRDRTQLAAAASEIHILASHLPFDTSRLRETRASVRAMQDRMLVLLPLLSGVTDRLAALEAEGGLAPGAAAIRAEAAQWIRDGADAEAGAALAARIAAWPRAAADDWRGLLTDSFMQRLQEAVQALGEAHGLLDHLSDPNAPAMPEVLEAAARGAAVPLHSDPGLALVSGATAVVAILVCCALWIGPGWSEGGVAAMMTAVFCSFFASQDDPAPSIANFGFYALLSLPVAALYLFAILPGIDSFWLLAATLFPTLLVAGLYAANPATTGKAVPFIITFVAALALQESFEADFASFLNGNLAQFVGVFVSIVTTRTLRSMSTEASARRLLRPTWRAVADLARRRAAPEPSAFAALLVDRLALLSGKLAAGLRQGDDIGEAALADLRVAMSLVAVQRLRGELDPAATARLDAVSEGVYSHFAQLAREGRQPPGPALLGALDAALSDIANLPGATGRAAAAGLVGLRRNLFPAAPRYRPAAAGARP
jgi:uncharacterized membrane protein YccC